MDAMSIMLQIIDSEAVPGLNFGLFESECCSFEIEKFTVRKSVWEHFALFESRIRAAVRQHQL